MERRNGKKKWKETNVKGISDVALAHYRSNNKNQWYSYGELRRGQFLAQPVVDALLCEDFLVYRCPRRSVRDVKVPVLVHFFLPVGR